ncbi:zinc-ribbon domain containing protein [Diaphorobacter caeni]|uniref:zinc-ribbon domain containing protein n=1 Tax=Diaphorobacter caeni TaxID=2784387 RepID=UPI00188FE100|nr:zinc-ribbon domain containing protein [Diaphorobacter caeni]MBF5005078.1 zinc-ribbon domain containing protein [Diaphorobacter caeni]
MKSNKQRRAEIKLARMERAVQQASNRVKDGRWTSGHVLADTTLLARINNTCGQLPAHYVDTAFRCCDCDSQEVWTAKQQKWWYEVIQAPIESRAVRCLACRRKRREALTKARSGAGANLLREETAWLRSVDRQMRDAETVQRVEAALQSKWTGIRKVAIEVLGRWRRPRDAAVLRAILQDETIDAYDPMRRAAAESLVHLLVHPDDDEWVMQVFVRLSYAVYALAPFVGAIEARTVDAFVKAELQRDDAQRLYHLCLMLMYSHRQPNAGLWAALKAHPSSAVAGIIPYVERRFQTG